MRRDVTDMVMVSMVVSLGPVGTVVRDIPRNPRMDGMGSNKRCLRRDINKHSAAGARANYTYNLIMDHPNIDAFYNRYLGQPMLQNDRNPWGVCAIFSCLHPFSCTRWDTDMIDIQLHNAGHYMIGGDPGGVSPSPSSPPSPSISLPNITPGLLRLPR